jgi:hyperosmotically inducible periplasmic protein
VTRHLVLALFIVAPSCDKADSNDVGRKPADNTRNNERDRDDATKTPMDQKENATDIDITATIRRAIVGDDAMSMSAKNIKIVTADGVVTLRGPVASTEEREKIANVARGTASVKRVDDLLEIAPE